MKNYPSIHAFISYIKTFKAPFIVTAAVFTVANALLAIIPWLIGELTQSLTDRTDMVRFWLLAVIAASVLHHIFWNIGDILYKKLLLARLHRFDDLVFGAIMVKGYGYFADRFTGKISSYAGTLGRELRDTTDSLLHSYIGMVVFLPIFTATMFTVNIYTGILFTISLMAMFVGGKPIARNNAKAERIETDAKSSIDGHAVDSIANFVTIKAFGNERREAKYLHERRTGLIRAADYSFLQSIYFWGYMGTVVRVVMWPSTFILTIYLFIRGDISVAQVSTFFAAIVIFQNYIWEVVWNFSQLNVKFARIDEAYRYLFGEIDIVTATATSSPEADNPTPPFLRSLEMKNLQFAYPDKPEVPVLQDINLTIRKGEKIGLVGPSGGGKSTLLKLLLGYYPSGKDMIFLDGKTIANRQLSDLISYVPQDTSVFHRSIRDNIAYGKPSATDEEVMLAARHAQAHDFIMQLSHGYDTLVGERGVKLSGGQRQRIAIARAVLKDAPILLLDEATSALDSESEQLIQAAFDDLFKGRTAIVIAHRLSTIQKLDRIVVIDAGRIVEVGTHSTLIAAGGLYASLWQHQSGGFMED